MALKAPIVDTIGLEFETGITQEDMTMFIRNNEYKLYHWQVHHDGSIDKIGAKLMGAPYYFENVIKRTSRNSSLIESVHMFGSELVSPLLDTSQDDSWKDSVKYITEYLRKCLDKPTPKVSTHIHINADKLPVGVLQNIIRTWMCFEDVFFRLSIGDELKFHRGTVRKDFLYCRPLSSPLVVLSDKKLFRPCFEVDKLLAAKNLREFFYAYGRAQIDGEPPRYYPARYSCVNFYSYLRSTGGSVEFRTPNLSTNPEIIFAWVELFKAIVRTSMGKPIEYPYMPLGTSPSNFNLDIFQSLFELSDDTMTILSYVFNENKWIDFNPRYVYSHTQQTEIYWENEHPKLIPNPIPVGEKIRRYSASSENDDYQEFDSYKNITNDDEPSSERTPRRTSRTTISSSTNFAEISSSESRLREILTNSNTGSFTQTISNNGDTPR